MIRVLALHCLLFCINVQAEEIRSAKANAEFGFANQHSKTKATLGLGNVTLGCDDEASQEAFSKMNRNATEANEELQGWDIKPLHIALPINSVHEILRDMGWLPDQNKPLTKGEKTWRELFREQIEFSDEMTSEEADKILEDVDKEFKPLEDDINQKFAKAKDDSNADAAADVVLAQMITEKAKQDAQKKQEIFKKNAENLRKEAEQSFATKGQKTSIQGELDKEKIRLTSAIDTKGLEHLKTHLVSAHHEASRKFAQPLFI